MVGWYLVRENKELPQLLVFHSLWKLQFGINISVFQGLDAFLGLLPSRKDYCNNFFLVSVFVLLLAIIAFYGIGQDIGFVGFWLSSLVTA